MQLSKSLPRHGGKKSENMKDKKRGTTRVKLKRNTSKYPVVKTTFFLYILHLIVTELTEDEICVLCFVDHWSKTSVVCVDCKR